MQGSEILLKCIYFKLKAMKLNKELRDLLAYRNQGLTLLEIIILKMLEKRPMYLVEIREVLDSDPGSVNTVINRLQEKGFVVKDKIPVKSGYQGPPLSALVRLKG